jgi:hypothetical protein
MNRADTFNRANTTSGVLGTPSDGKSAWQMYYGKFDINTNRAILSNVSGAYACALLECGESDGILAVTLVNPSTLDTGVWIRCESQLSGIYIDTNRVAGTVRIWKQVGTNDSILLGSGISNIANGSELSVTFIGTNITVKVDSVTKATAISDYNLYSRKHGLWGSSSDIGAIVDLLTFNGNLNVRGDAPSPVARGNPTSTDYFLKNGFSAKISFPSTLGDIVLWEKAITPMGVDGGAPVDDSNMFDVKWQIQTPRGLATCTPVRATVAYDPKVYEAIVNLIDSGETDFYTYTVTFPNGDMQAFYGALTQFIPNEETDGQQPTASIQIIVTNFTQDNGWITAEQGPTLTEA